MNRAEIGSMTAKGGFLNENDICDKFLNFKTDTEAQLWLTLMGYDYSKVCTINAIQIPVRINKKKALGLGVTEEKFEETSKYKKADIQVKLEITIDNIIYVENISLKKADFSAGFNQVDKRPVSTYQKMWKFNKTVEESLNLFTGTTPPKEVLSNEKLNNIKDSKQRRLFLDELSPKSFKEIKQFFENNKTLVISDILRGRGSLSAEWFLVTRKNRDDTLDWILKDINTVCNFFSQGNVEMSPRGSLKIGRVTMQRKGGTPDPTSLQFKINPLDLFELENA